MFFYFFIFSRLCYPWSNFCTCFCNFWGFSSWLYLQFANWKFPRPVAASFILSFFGIEWFERQMSNNNVRCLNNNPSQGTSYSRGRAWRVTIAMLCPSVAICPWDHPFRVTRLPKCSDRYKRGYSATPNVLFLFVGTLVLFDGKGSRVAQTLLPRDLCRNHLRVSGSCRCTET